MATLYVDEEGKATIALCDLHAQEFPRGRALRYFRTCEVCARERDTWDRAQPINGQLSQPQRRKKEP